MKSIVTSLLLAGLFLAGPAAGAGGKRTQADKSTKISKPFDLFEVMIKYKDSGVRYRKPLPGQYTQEQMVGMTFRKVGLAFAVSNREIVSAARLFDLGQMNLGREYFLRSRSGEVFQVEQVNRYDEYRGMIQVQINDGGRHWNPVKPTADRGLLKAPQRVCMPQIVGVHSPRKLTYRCTRIVAVQKEPKLGKMRYYRLELRNHLGSFGAPLMTSKGEYIGLVTGMLPKRQNLTAVPLSYLQRAPINRAVFWQAQARVQDGFGLGSERAFFHTTHLPRKPEDLSEDVREARQDFYKKLSQSFQRKFASKMITGSRAVEEQFPHQIGNFKQGVFAPIDNERYGWKMVPNEYFQLNLSKRRSIQIGRHRHVGLTGFFMDRSPTDDVETLLSQPRRVMADLMKVLPIRYRLGKGVAKVYRVGEPVESWRRRDALGRYWAVNSFYLPASHELAFLYQTATPTGIFGLVEQVPVAAVTPVHIDQRMLDLNHFLIRYEATPLSWQQFFVSGVKPRAMGLSILHKRRDMVLLEVDDLHAELPIRALTPMSHMAVSLGYLPGQIKVPRVLAVNFLIHGAKNEQVAYHRHSAPVSTGIHYSQQTGTYFHALAGRAPFDGQARESAYGFEVHQSLPGSLGRSGEVWIKTCRSMTLKWAKSYCATQTVIERF